MKDLERGYCNNACNGCDFGGVAVFPTKSDRFPEGRLLCTNFSCRDDGLEQLVFKNSSDYLDCQGCLGLFLFIKHCAFVYLWSIKKWWKPAFWASGILQTHSNTRAVSEPPGCSCWSLWCGTYIVSQHKLRPMIFLFFLVKSKWGLRARRWILGAWEPFAVMVLNHVQREAS